MSDLASSSLTNLLPALVAAQAGFAPAVKDARNSHFGSEYLTLAAALVAILPALNANGLALSQQTYIAGAGLVVRTVLWHVSGEWVAAEYPILPTKSDPQGFGSALTYARRYAAMALVGIAPEDDDGEAASAPPARAEAAKLRGRPPRMEEAATQSPQPDVHADALAADLADALDDAATEARLAELLPALQSLPEDRRGPLRERFAETRTRIRAGAGDNPYAEARSNDEQD